MTRLVVIVFLVFVSITTLISGCTPNIISPVISPTPTSSLIPSKFTPEPISTTTLNSPIISPQLTAIENIRSELELPELPLILFEKTVMTDTPNGDLEVVVYQDSAGRKYYVDPENNQVIEMKFIILLPKYQGYSPTLITLSREVLKTKAMKYFKATIPNFEYLQSSMQYEEFGEGDYFFFTWYGDMKYGLINRPFAQIGLVKSGLLFDYFNTLLLNQ